MQRLLVLAWLLVPTAACSQTKDKVVLETSMGNLTIRCFTDKAPLSCKNFFDYVDAGFYSGTVFHRVIDGFMIQGGGFSEKLDKKDTRPPVKNEADNGLKNTRGTVALARTSDPDSATSQFFINLVDNAALDHRGKDMRGWGYAVFGEVIAGMDVVDKIKAVDTLCPSRMAFPCNDPLPPGMRDVPVTPVVIVKATRQ
jgi:cyclophilin family peptidyl-prolyl cis-trans isomerase